MTSRSKPFFLLVALLICQLAQGQTSIKDSITSILDRGARDTATANRLIEAGSLFDQSNAHRAISFYLAAKELSVSIKYIDGVEKSNTGCMEAYMTLSMIDSIKYYVDENVNLARAQNDSLKIGRALANLAVSYRTMLEYDEALKYFIESRQYLGNKGDISVKIAVLDAMQALYYDRSEYAKGIALGTEALPLARKLNDPFTTCKVIINLAINYNGNKEQTKARLLLEEALEINKKLQSPMVEVIALQNLADISLKQNRIPQTKAYLLRGLKLIREMGSPDSEATCLRGLAICALQEKDISLAKSLADTVLSIAQSYKLLKEEAAIKKVLSVIAYLNGKTEEGLRLDFESEAVLEKMITDIISTQTLQLEKKYETAKKQEQIEKLKAEKKVQELTIRQKTLNNYLLMAGAVLLLLFIYITIKNHRQKQKIQQQRITELETEKMLTATQAIIKGEEQERTRLARDLHDGLGGMLSGIKHSLNTMKGNLIMTPENAAAFERSIDMLNTSIQEMRRVAHNMMPEALVKFGLDTALNDFCTQLNQSGSVPITYQSIGVAEINMDQTKALNIFRIIQELVNNSIKHAKAKNILVQLIRSDDKLSITVEDDGIGFISNELNLNKGIGWQNLRSRIDYLKGELDLITSPGNGTSVMISIIL